MEKSYKNTYERMMNDGSVGVVMFNSYIFGLKYEDGKLHFGNLYNYNEFLESGKGVNSITILVPEKFIDVHEDTLNRYFDIIVEKYIEKYVYPLYKSNLDSLNRFQQFVGTSQE